MKDEYKILIGAIVVILLVLAGAFALSGSNNSGAKATPTATVAPANNPTATATPGGNGGTPSATPTATPSVPAPTPDPGSGVKLTEFGYWITYPPLGPQNWSAYKPTNQGPSNNTVYFDPTSGSVTVNYSSYESAPHVAYAYVHLKGDTNGTTIVHLNVESSANFYHYNFGPDAIDPGTYSEYHISGNIYWINETDFMLTFLPGQNNSTLTIYTYDVYTPREFSAAAEDIFQGYVKLTIVGADNGYTYGYNKDYTLNVGSSASPYSVTFEWASGYINSYGGSGYTTNISMNGGPEGMLNLSIDLRRYDDLAGALTVPLHFSNLNSSDGYTAPDSVTFNPGEDSASTWVCVPENFVEKGYSDIIKIEIGSPGSTYTVGPIKEYSVDMNQPGIP